MRPNNTPPTVAVEAEKKLIRVWGESQLGSQNFVSPKRLFSSSLEFFTRTLTLELIPPLFLSHCDHLATTSVETPQRAVHQRIKHGLSSVSRAKLLLHTAPRPASPQTPTQCILCVRGNLLLDGPDGMERVHGPFIGSASTGALCAARVSRRHDDVQGPPLLDDGPTAMHSL